MSGDPRREDGEALRRSSKPTETVECKSVDGLIEEEFDVMAKFEAPPTSSANAERPRSRHTSAKRGRGHDRHRRPAAQPEARSRIRALKARKSFARRGYCVVVLHWPDVWSPTEIELSALESILDRPDPA